MAGEVLTIRDQVALQIGLVPSDEDWSVSNKEKLAGYPEPESIGIEYLKWDAAWRAGLMLLRADIFLEKRCETTTT